MKKNFIAVAVVCALGWLLYNHMYSNSGFPSFVHALAATSEVKVSKVQCVQILASRSGYCQFSIEEPEMGLLVERLGLSDPRAVSSNNNGRKQEPIYIQDHGCAHTDDFDYVSNPAVGLYLEKEGARVRDEARNISFHALFYNRTLKKGCLQLYHPYG